MENTRKTNSKRWLGEVRADNYSDTPVETVLTQALLELSDDRFLTTQLRLKSRRDCPAKRITKMHKKVPQAASLGVLTVT